MLIPIAFYKTTLGSSQTSSWVDDHILAILAEANRIWSSSRIQFQSLSISVISSSQSTVEILNDTEFFFLASKYPGNSSVSVFLVNTIESTEAGNSAILQTSGGKSWVAAVEYDGSSVFSGRVLAHELGHLLEVRHSNEGFVQGPRHPFPRSMRDNLMFSSILNHSLITRPQINTARASALAHQFP